METLSLEQGMLVSTCPTSWALRMRVSMSAIGSLMLIGRSLPARLDYTRHFAVQRELAQLDAPESELLVYAARPPRQSATVAQAHRRGIPWQPLQLGARRVAV